MTYELVHITKRVTLNFMTRNVTVAKVVLGCSKGGYKRKMSVSSFICFFFFFTCKLSLDEIAQDRQKSRFKTEKKFYTGTCLLCHNFRPLRTSLWTHIWMCSSRGRERERVYILLSAFSPRKQSASDIKNI